MQAPDQQVRPSRRDGDGVDDGGDVSVAGADVGYEDAVADAAVGDVGAVVRTVSKC